jgi:hypothetical protein
MKDPTKQQYKEANTLLEAELRLLKIDFQDVKKKLEQDVKNLEDSSVFEQSRIKQDSNFLDTIMKIVNGKSKPLSKIEVLRDLINPQPNVNGYVQPSPLSY